MVTKKLVQRALLLLTVLSVTLIMFNSIPVEAQNIEYYLNNEYAKIWINQTDGTIDLLYNITITCTQGVIHYIRVGQPKGDFTIGPTKDEEGRILSTLDASSGEYYGVRVNLYTPISAGQSVWFTLLTNVGHMIWEDEDNPGNVGMQFIPCWWDAPVDELRLAVVLPEGVTKENVKCTPDWDNAYKDPDEENRLVIYWEKHNLQENEKFPCGVSFPKEYVEYYDVRRKGIDWSIAGWVVLGVLAIGVCSVVIVFRKRGYLNPILRIETLGVRRGLTAVEASYLLDFPPTKIVTEILYSLLMKKAVWVKATTPALKLEVMKPFKDETGTYETPLRYYEKSSLKAIKKNGTLDEVKLAETIMQLRDTVEDKLRGYCRQDTIAYYKNIVAKAWQQVRQAGTPEIASKAYNENLLWLLLDKNFESQTKGAFSDRVFRPEIDWWWYWYGYTYYYPKPTYKPVPATAKPPPTIPGAEFANNIVTSIEKTANNVVANIEKFANSILPAPPPSQHTSRAPAHDGASCVCACASCACVCACVSCACACASGGVGIAEGRK
ncbi:MAG: hypothetical protein NWE85_04595 [Candidatus Bathyarchaeota archaeon]|nr:hypothetical protein [Candidatus Bathyarchaeota archaeon]